LEIKELWFWVLIFSKARFGSSYFKTPQRSDGFHKIIGKVSAVL
jgi:hypothetical protein